MKEGEIEARRAARLGAVQALYQMEVSGASTRDVIAEFDAGKLPRETEASITDGEADRVLFKTLVEKAVDRQATLDRAIARHLSKGWRLERLDAVARAILRAGVAELEQRPDIPVAVVIDEYVEIAKRFFDGPEPGFVNATLDACARDLRPGRRDAMAADEFEVIRDLFAPLARSEGARGLSDDVAVLEASGKLVVTTDAIVEGVHFLALDPIDTVAKKALRVNLSDLTAKGARCVGVLVTLIWPSERPSAQIAAFARGLGEDLQLFDVALLGGDTTSTRGPLTVSITAFGAPLGQAIPSRAGARVGEHVWVTGFIGDAFLGLRALEAGTGPVGARASEHEGGHDIIDAYRVPRPPVAFAAAIANHASASTDVSDGLAGDAANIARASKVALSLRGEGVPLSSAGHAYVSKFGALGLADLVSGGDDYQALFTAAPERGEAIKAAARAANVNVALIGDVVEGEGVSFTAGDERLALGGLGHRHELGR